MVTKLSVVTNWNSWHLHNHNFLPTEVGFQEVKDIIDGESFTLLLWKIRQELLHSDTSSTLNERLDDNSFFTEINKHIFSKIPEIYENPSSDSYKEIYFFIHLLSVRFNFDFFQDWDIFSKENFNRIFSAYINKIQSFQDISSLESISYLEGFIRLCWVVNLICNLSQNDNLKRENIKLLTVLIHNKINELSKILEQKKFEDKAFFNSLKYILWLLKLNFSYIEFVNLDLKNDNWINNFLSRYKEIFFDTIEWYDLCKESDFWNALEKEKSIKRVAAINLTHIVSLIIFKLKQNPEIKEEDILENLDFKEIIRKYIWFINQKFSFLTIDTNINFLEDIIKICNLVLFTNYSWESRNFLNNCEDFLKTVIKEWNIEVMEVDDLEILHHLILFNNINFKTLIEVFNFLYTTKSSININFEVIRLKIYNIILTKLSTFKKPELKKILSSLTEYTDRNKVSSHLLFVYSLMYATIWYCYSFFDDNESHLLAIENYAKFKQINPLEFDFQRYGINILQFHQNIWVLKFKNAWIMWPNCSRNCELWLCQESDRDCQRFDTEAICYFWQVILSDAHKAYTKQTWNVLLNELDTFLHLQGLQTLDMEILNQKVSRVLSNIFHWVADIQVFSNREKRRLDIPKYYKNLDIDLKNWYTLRMIYPNTFLKYFEDIYNSNDSESTTTISLVVNKLIAFFEKYNEENKEEISVINDFERAFEENRIKLFSHWIFDDKKNLKKLELLTRVLNPIKKENWKEYNIREYIDIAIKNGRKDLLKKLVKYTIDCIKENSDSEGFSINMEYLNMVDDETILFFSQLKEEWFDVSKITIELIEWKWNDDSAVIDNICFLKELGYKIAMDDFWSWESSLNRLLKLMWLLNYVKIDGDIIKNLKGRRNWITANIVRKLIMCIWKRIWWIIWCELTEKDKLLDSSSEAIIRMLVTICKSHNIKIVAEYVEDEPLFQRLKGLGVHMFQWYYFWKPEPFENKKDIYEN